VLVSGEGAGRELRIRQQGTGRFCGGGGGGDPCRLAAQAQVIRVIAMVAPKAGVEAARGRERERILAAMAGDLRGKSP
jgi:hypothetical protein